jgi:hypothetical protein
VRWQRFSPIPAGLDVLHHCDKPACVNPIHLFLGTQADNNRDCVAKGRHNRGERQWLAKLTDAAVRYARRRYREGGCGVVALDATRRRFLLAFTKSTATLRAI